MTAPATARADATRHLGSAALQRLVLLDDGLADRSKVHDGHSGLSVRTVRYIHTIVGSILKSAVKNRLLNHNPNSRLSARRIKSLRNRRLARLGASGYWA